MYAHTKMAIKDEKILYILIGAIFQFMSHEQKQYTIPFVKNKIILINEFIDAHLDAQTFWQDT